MSVAATSSAPGMLEHWIRRPEAATTVSLAAMSIPEQSPETPEEFVAELCRAAEAHAAASHPYLVTFSEAGFPDMPRAIADFAYQYGHYSAGFSGYLEAAVRGLREPAHRVMLEKNLREERAEAPDGDTGNDVPHAELFRRFQCAAGVDEGYRQRARPCGAVRRWRHTMQTLCSAPIEGIAIGALGPGTELIVPQIYKLIASGLRHTTLFDEEALLFFDLHQEADEEHAAQLRRIATDIAVTQEGREALQLGTRLTLDMRRAFWDEMLRRAMLPPDMDDAHLAGRGESQS